MVKSLSRTVVFLLCVVVFSLMAGGAASAASAPSTAGWSRHTDPAGFSVDTPAGWEIATDQQSGRITFSGKQGEHLTVWPMFVQGRQLDRNGASTIVQQLARKINAGLPWQKPEYAGNMVRVVARNAQQNSVTLLSWNPSPEGTTLLAFVIEAPPAIYRASVETFTGILGTFRIRQTAGNGGTAPQSYSSGRLSLVRWTDPRENAFSLSIPEGWTATGGLYRMSVTDLRPSAQILSPDHHIQILFMDPGIGPFAQLTQVMARGGLREGSFQTLRDGTKLFIRSFCPGQQFAREYVEGVIGRQVGDLRVTASSDRPDLASAYRAEFLAEGGTGLNLRMTAGDVSFTCTLRGSGNSATRVMGYVSVATYLVSLQQSSTWYVYRLYGYLAPAERQAEADSVCRQVVASFKIDPQWRMRQRQASAALVQQSNRDSEAIRQRSRIIADAGRETNKIIMDVHEHQKGVVAKRSHDWSNTILDRTDVMDERTGTTYNISVTPNGNYNWIDGLGNIVATQSNSAPGPFFHQLTDLP